MEKKMKMIKHTIIVTASVLVLFALAMAVSSCGSDSEIVFRNSTKFLGDNEGAESRDAWSFKIGNLRR
jgi:hypothetical protein